MINQSARDRILYGLKSRDRELPVSGSSAFTICQLIALRTRDAIGFKSDNVSAYDVCDLIAEMIVEVEKALRAKGPQS